MLIVLIQKQAAMRISSGRMVAPDFSKKVDAMSERIDTLQGSGMSPPSHCSEGEKVRTLRFSAATERLSNEGRTARMLNRIYIPISKQYFLIAENTMGSDTVFHLAFTEEGEMVVVSRESFEQHNKADTVRYYEPSDFDSRTIDGRSMREVVMQKLPHVLNLKKV